MLRSAYAGRSARSVHSRETANVPPAVPRRLRLSIPPIRRTLSTGKRCPRNGWYGCVISADPKCVLGWSAVGAGRRYPQSPLPTKFISASPTQELTSSGPWLLVKTSVGLWATNEDGSSLALLTQGDNWASDLAAAVQPLGDQVVVLTSSDDGFPSLGEHHLALNLLSLPDGGLRKITDLTSPQTEPGPSYTLGDTSLEAVRAIMEQNSYAWSPDGTRRSCSVP